MSRTDLGLVGHEVRRFLSRLEDLNKRLNEAPAGQDTRLRLVGCAETAALRRSSLDLSMALAKLRR